MQGDEKFHTQVRNVPVWGDAFWIKEFGSHILENDS